MTVDQRFKRRWCGYCSSYIHEDWDGFQKHLNYCELTASYRYKCKSKNDQKKDKPNG